MTLLLSNRDVARAITMRETVEHLEISFKDQALGRLLARPPRSSSSWKGCS
jgi:hypothetical protein